jgi:hypothetical protein
MEVHTAETISQGQKELVKYEYHLKVPYFIHSVTINILVLILFL